MRLKFEAHTFEQDSVPVGIREMGKSISNELWAMKKFEMVVFNHHKQ